MASEMLMGAFGTTGPEPPPPNLAPVPPAAAPSSATLPFAPRLSRARSSGSTLPLFCSSVAAADASLRASARCASEVTSVAAVPSFGVSSAPTAARLYTTRAAFASIVACATAPFATAARSGAPK